MQFTLTPEEQAAFDIDGSDAKALLESKVEEVMNRASLKRTHKLITDIQSIPEGAAKEALLAQVEALKPAKEQE